MTAKPAYDPYHAVYQRLSDLIATAAQADPVAVASATRSETIVVTGALWDLLLAHEPDDLGYCRACSRWLPRRGPCPVWLFAMYRLVPEDLQWIRGRR